MREDDLEVGEIRRDVVHVHRVEYFSRIPMPPGMPRADAGLAGGEQRDRAAIIDRLIERIGHPVVGVEALHGRVEFEAADAVLLDQLARLIATPSLPL